MKYLRRLISHDEFIEQATLIHNNKYDYSSVEIKSARDKIEIVCPIHGKFTKYIGQHLKGSGCRSCLHQSISMSQEEFIQRSQSVHKGYYDYSLVAYTNSDTVVKIVCPKHGVFEQRPYLHLRGSKCASCAKVKKKTTHEFICEALSIHDDKYDYSSTHYVSCNQKVEILCSKHGQFWITPDAHINGQQGCSKCTTSISWEETVWLNIMNVSLSNRQLRIKVDSDVWLKVDGYDPISKTVYEYNGDYYHGNPAKYKPEDINHRCGLTFGELYEKTVNREQQLKQAGYKVVSIWGSEFKKLYKPEIRKYREYHGRNKVCTVT